MNVCVGQTVFASNSKTNVVVSISSIDTDSSEIRFKTALGNGCRIYVDILTGGEFVVNLAC